MDLHFSSLKKIILETLKMFQSKKNYIFFLFCLAVFCCLSCKKQESVEPVRSQPLPVTSNTPYPTYAATPPTVESGSRLAQDYSQPTPAQDYSQPTPFEIPKTTSTPTSLEPSIGATPNTITGDSARLIWESQYIKLLSLCPDIDFQHQEIAQIVKTLLANIPSPIDTEATSKIMTVSLIGSVTAYWEENKNLAKELGARAFSSRSDGEIHFPECWENLREYYNNHGYDLAQKLALAKDFLLSCSNAGFDRFQTANRNFVVLGKFWDAIEEYKHVLRMGLDDTDLRHTTHIRLATCLFHAQKSDDAEEVLLHTWLVNKSLEDDFVNTEAQNFFESTMEKYSE